MYGKTKSNPFSSAFLDHRSFRWTSHQLAPVGALYGYGEKLRSNEVAEKGYEVTKLRSCEVTKLRSYGVAKESGEAGLGEAQRL